MRRILVLLGVLCLSSLSVAEEKIRLTTGEFPPFTSQNLKHNGVITRIVTEAFALEGVTVEYGWYPWKRAYSQAKEGSWNGSSYYKKTPEREKDFIYSDVLTTAEYVFFHKKDFSFDWNDFQDLSGIPIGGTLGYFYRELFSPLEKTGILDVQWTSDDKSNMGKLLKDRIRIFPSNLDATYYLLHKEFTPEEVSNITHHPKTLSDHGSFLILSKKIKENVRFMKLFNRGLQRLKDSGKYDQYFMESRRGDYNL